MLSCRSRQRSPGRPGSLLVRIQLLFDHPAVLRDRLGWPAFAGGLGRPRARCRGRAPSREEDEEGYRMKSAEGRGRTLEEAVDAALIQLGESRRNVDVKILSESVDETHVEVIVIEPAAAAPRDGADMAGDAETAKAIVGQLLARMGVRCSVSSRATPEAIVVDVSGRDLGVLIGWRGETLRALQTMTNLLASRRIGPDQRVI